MTVSLDISALKALLLDIEGTVAPVEFVYGTLFPFARKHLSAFMANHQSSPDVGSDVQLLWQEYQQETPEEALPTWNGEFDGAIAYVEYLMERDRKSTGLKSLQGKIWNEGYSSGALKSQLFEEVPAAFRRWASLNKPLYIYSSGSVQAQILIFRYSEQGDLTPLIQDYFDTQVGPKKESSSYQAIAQTIGLKPEDILFISDVEAELDAAQKSGMKTLLSVRPGNHEILRPRFETITSLDQVF